MLNRGNNKNNNIPKNYIYIYIYITKIYISHTSRDKMEK
jgi:hypothetical protein